jgi:hypothetical protein
MGHEVLAADQDRGRGRRRQRADAADHEDLVQPGRERRAGDRFGGLPGGRGQRRNRPGALALTDRGGYAVRAGGQRGAAQGSGDVASEMSPVIRVANTVPKTAIPVAMPTWRNVVLMPEAIPAAPRRCDRARGRPDHPHGQARRHRGPAGLIRPP